MAEQGWHLQLWIDVKDLPETIPVLKALGLPVVTDHMGLTDARAGTATAGFQSLLRVLSEGWCWVKLSGAHRLSRDAPDYPDARPFHEALVRANPERLVWGGDWPHPRSKARCPMPDTFLNCFRCGRRTDRPASHPRQQSRKTLRFPELKVRSKNDRQQQARVLRQISGERDLCRHPAGAARVRLDRLENESPDEVSAPILAAAHAYQIGAARDELASHFHVHRDLLARAPNLLIVSSNGAGYDPVDVEACTAAGVLVVNQSGGNAHSVAEHALAMLITLSNASSRPTGPCGARPMSIATP